MSARSGSVIIIVAGIAALLVVLAVAFLSRMRADADENLLVVREAQARIMLVAGCHYVQEASRIGWDLHYDTDSVAPDDAPMTHPNDGAQPPHEEGFGWIDVRATDPSSSDAIGPRDQQAQRIGRGDNDPLGRPWWPRVGGVARSPMDVMVRPPFAVRLTAAYNPIATDTTIADWGMPYARKPDPLPVAADWDAFRFGIRDPRPRGANLAWFRVYRKGVAQFIITAGAGATQGWKDFDEAVAWGGDDWKAFGSDQASARSTFATIAGSEARLWYEIEWTAAAVDPDYQNLDNEVGGDHYQWRAMNVSNESRSQNHARNLGGTIRWIQRLEKPPVDGNW